MSMLTNLDLLRRVPMFSMLSEAQANSLSESVVKRRYKRGERIVEQGSKSNALYIILSGHCRVVMTDAKGREVILATLQAGDHIGEMSLIDNEAHSATVEAESLTDVLELGREAFTRSLTESASMAYTVLCGLVARLRIADRKIAKMVGASREMVSRVMKDFLDQGFIQALEGGAMRIVERRSKPR